MSGQEMEQREPEVADLAMPGQAVLEAFEGAPLDPAVWSMFAQIAKVIKDTEFVPSGLRGKEPGILACMLYGHAQGLNPMVALAEIAMIDGKPAMSAELMVAKIRAAGHSLTREEIRDADGNLVGITAHGTRRDNGDKDSFTFTLDMARRAGLLSKKNWQNYPEAMLWARPAAQIARMLFADVFLGLSVYVPDELGAVTDEEGTLVEEIPEDASGGRADSDSGVPSAERPEREPDEQEPGMGARTPAPTPQAAVEEALEETYPPEGLPRLTREIIEACETRADLLALAHRYGVKHATRDPISTLTEKLMRFVKDHEEDEPPEPTGLAFAVDGGEQPVEEPVAEEAARDALAGRMESALAYVATHYPDSQLTREAVLQAAGKQFDRQITTFYEFTAEEAETIWNAFPETVRDAVVAAEGEAE